VRDLDDVNHVLTHSLQNTCAQLVSIGSGKYHMCVNVCECPCVCVFVSVCVPVSVSVIQVTVNSEVIPPQTNTPYVAVILLASEPTLRLHDKQH
jgi:hypothetical protein